MIDLNQISFMKVGIASPEKMLQWSYGEVKKPETINYRTLKPERDGLFCEKIFGPTRDWACSCGKYKRVRYKGVICDRCGVEVTKSSVRRERMGHIELAAPVSHIWYFKGAPNRMGLLLDMMPKHLEEIIYFVSYVVTDKGDTPLEEKQLLTEREYRIYYEKYGNKFKAAMGAAAIQTLLANLDLDKESAQLREDLKVQSGQKKVRTIKRLEVVEAFRQSGNRPEWMIMNVIPVIPPNIRPMVELDGGRFATSDLNDLYRRVINRNNRLKKLIELGAPSIIVQNEKRMLQEAVDSLIDNGRRGRPVTGPGNRPLKSLSSMLKGKQGRFRQNLLGKRVDYSGRSVIVVGPTLKFYQCGLPKEMALELFKPFVINKLVEREYASNIKVAKRMIDNRDEEVWNVLTDVVEGHPVLLNRAPTLHRLGIQAFEPRLIEGKAIRLHPLVTPAFNADFDGDQMAVHVPLSKEAQAEARLLMLAANNILNPKDGKPVVTPSQDMVLGNYYLTMEDVNAEQDGKLFISIEEAKMAYQLGEVTLHTRVIIKVKNLDKVCFDEEDQEKYLITSVGKLIFNEIFPKDFPYINEPSGSNIENGLDKEKHLFAMGTNLREVLQTREAIKPFTKGTLGKIISRIFHVYRTTETAKMLDKMKDLGFTYSTKAGITVAVSDIVVLEDKGEILEKAQKQVDKIQGNYNFGLTTDAERKRAVVAEWTTAKDQIQDKLMQNLDDLNPIFMMADSGARGNASNFTQLAGMRGLMSNPKGEIIELPIRSSFREGLTVLEYFISTHGARKGLADTALKTADSGYLTRRLVDVSQDVIVRDADCGTKRGLIVEAIQDGTELIEPLSARIIGRYAKRDIKDPNTGEIFVHADELITEETCNRIEQAGITTIEIRSVLTCNTANGVCQKCYGNSLATGELVEIGEAVGIMAAQSIGEPGTQLTMRTFHTGGVAGGGDVTQGLPRVQELFEARNPKGKAILAEIDGNIMKVENIKDRYHFEISNNLETREYVAPYGARLKVNEGDFVTAGQALTEGSIDPKGLLHLGSVTHVQNYIVKEIQRVYRLQGVEIEDKHIEVIVRQMMRKVRVVDGGSTSLLPGGLVDVNEFTAANLEVLAVGKKPAVAIPILMGITKSSLETNSFLSAASFQETTRVLTDAAVKGKVDNLLGLKENVIIGKMIPAGTGFKKYASVEIERDEMLVDVEDEYEMTEAVAE
ncbi:MAG: DNA-directed RNA polymerase subunit beta' [Culicoidibacterales bacterium]